MPISAFFSDGASLTPSPVIATILLFALMAVTIFTLCSGETLANTLTVFTFSIRPSVVRSFISLPSSTSAPSSIIPSICAIAAADFL
jgi:hypothetical protein